MKTLLFILGIAVIAAGSECPEGWIETVEGDANRCYRFVEEPLKWPEARDMCRNANGDLVSVNSANEREWLLMKLTDYSKRDTKAIWHWWSGLHLMDGEWMWVNGIETDDNLVNWQPNQPDQSTQAEKCGELHRTGMNDNDCDDAFPYICVKGKDEPSSPCDFGEVEMGGSCINPNPQTTPKAPVKTSVIPGPEPSQGSCAGGWVQSSADEDRCYRFEKVEQTWWDAKNLCELAHGQLVNIRNPVEKDWVLGQVQRLGHESSHWFGLYNEPARPSWWTGLKKLKAHMGGKGYKYQTTESQWTWADDSEADSSLINWQSGEPNLYGNENCGELHVSGFNDNSCDTKFPFICARRKDYEQEEDCNFGEYIVDGHGGCVKYEAGQALSTTTATPITAIPSHVPVKGDCLEGWEESPVTTDRCYRFEKEKKLDWERAEKTCQSARGELVSFRNEEETDWIKNVLVAMEGKNTWPRRTWWTGLNRLSSDRHWMWSDGTLLNDTNIPWMPNEPNNEMERCGQMYTTGINDNGCWKKFNFICTRDKSLVKNYIECPFGQVLMGRKCEDLQFPELAMPATGSCPEGWVEGVVTPGTCYRFVTSTETHENAKLMCRAANADLLVVKSEVEQTWLEQQLQRESQTSGMWAFYIGLEQTNNEWKWFDGSLVEDPSSTLKGSNTQGTCATMLPAGIQREQCWGSKAYICSRPAALDPGAHECPWGEQWADGKCNVYSTNSYDYNYKTRVDYAEGLDVKRLEDGLQRLKGKHEREMMALKHAFKSQINDLVERIQSLENTLKIRDRPTSTEAPILDFDPSLTLLISNLPQNMTDDPKQIVIRFFTDVLQLSNVNVIHASKYGGRGNNTPKIKVLLANQRSKKTVMGARKRAKVIPGYENVRIVAAPMRLRPKKE